MNQEEKQKKIQAFREHHADLIKQLGIDEKDFNVKLAFFDKGEKVVGVFPSEFKRKNGLYFEFTDNEFNPSDPKRQVYKLSLDDDYEKKYDLLRSGAHAVPITNLEEVHLFNGAQYNFDDLEKVSESGNEDSHYNTMTIRDYVAIKHKAPVSNKKWLNTLIKSLK